MSFDQVKNELMNLYSSYTNNFGMINNAVGPYIEHFSMHGFPKPDAEFDRQFLLSPDVPQEVKQLGFLPSELYDVISKFDLGPHLLNDNEKNLRRKYLNMLKVYMDMQYKNVMARNSPEAIQMLQTSNDPNSLRILSYFENAAAFKNFIDRIINLLLQEMGPISSRDSDARNKVQALANMNACNMELCVKRYETAVRNKRGFNNSSRAFKECKGCPSMWYNASNDTFSEDGKVWRPVAQNELNRLRGGSR